MIMKTRIFFYLIIIFYIWVFGGIHLNLKNIIYDEWRVLSLILLLVFSIVSIVYINLEKNKSLLIAFNHKVILFLSVFTFVFLFYNLHNYFYLSFSLVDFSLYVLLALGCVGLYHLHINMLDKNEDELRRLYLIISFSPILVVIYFVLSLIQFWFSYSIFDWKIQFSNIRMYDSVILIFIFLLLNFRQFLNNYALKFLSVFLLFCYILSLFFDNARSAILSLLIGLGAIFFLYRDIRRIIILPIILTIMSGFIYWFYQIFYPVSTMIRVTSSGRSTLWSYAWEKWLQYPIVGMGGASFGLDQKNFSSRSAHNVVIQLVGEWGVIGYIYLGIIGVFIGFILKYRNNIPPFLLAGTIAIMVDSMFSAILIYPLLMFVCANFFALTLAYCPRENEIRLSQKFIYTQKSFYLFALFFSVYTIFNIHGNDILCMGCKSMDEFHAPRFWEYGRTLHLQPMNKDSN